MSKRVNWFICIALALIAVAGGIYAALAPTNSMMNWYENDDAFYYYKVAQNILTGHGSTFDGINLSNGYHPLWMVVCLAVFWLSKFSIILPLRVLIVVSALLNGLSCVLLYQMLKDHLHPAAAVIGALTLALYPLIYDTLIIHGMESALSLFFIILYLKMAARFFNRPADQLNVNRQLFWVGLVGALTILARLDNLFLVVIVGFALLLRIKKIPTLMALDIIAFTVSVFLAWIIRLGANEILMSNYSVYPMLVVAILIKPLVFYLAGRYTSPKSKSLVYNTMKIGFTSVVAMVVEYVVLYLLFATNITIMFSRSLIILNGGITFVLVFLVHLFHRSAHEENARNPYTLIGNWVRENWKGFVKSGIVFGAPIAVLLGIYMTWNQIVFGTFMPVSGQVKAWWGTLSNTIYTQPKTFLTVLGFNTGRNTGPWALLTSPIHQLAEKISGLFQSNGIDQIFGLLLILAVAGFFLILHAKNGRGAQKSVTLLIPPVMIGCVLHIAKYTAFSYAGTRSWYWVAEMLILVIVGSVILDALITWMDQWKVKFKFSWLLVLVAAGFLMVDHARYVVSMFPPTVSAEAEFRYLAEFKELENYTEPGTLIGMTGSGMTGYFITDRTIVNLDGLINSVEYFEAMKNGTAAAFLDELGLDYVYSKPYTVLQSDPYAGVFKDRLEKIGYIRGINRFTLYQYIPAK